jgi:hypothetical protein
LKLFDKLDRDHEGTLDKRESRGRLNAKDSDNDGTIDSKELKSAAGRPLVLLLK